MTCDSFCPITFSTAATCYVCSFHGRCKKEAAVSAANTDNGKAGYELSNQIPAHNVSETPGGFKSEN